MESNNIDFSILKAGENDPYLNKYIHTLIIQDVNYIVYLDNQLNVQWNVNSNIKTPALGLVQNKVAILQAKSDFIRPMIGFKIFAKITRNKCKDVLDLYSDPSLIRIRSLLGESIARIFDGHEVDHAQAVLNEAEKLISVKNAEYARDWYYNHATATLGGTIFLASMLWLARGPVTPFIGRTAFELSFCSLFGAMGAFVFIARRGQRIELDAISGPRIHKIEADARLGTGLVAAAIVNLAIKSGLLFGSISSSHQLDFMVMMSILAGYSERFIPNMVKKFSTSTETDGFSKDSSS